MTAACVTVKVWPATVSVPVREPAVLTAAAKVTDPFPVPEAADVIDSQDALLLAVHVQPLAVVTPTVPVPPRAGTF
jgi:hypothetical protein